MFSKFRPISISLSPNVQKDDVFLAVKLLFQPWRWTGYKSAPGSAITSLEEEFRKYLGVKYAISFNSGRSSLYAILKALNLSHGNTILMQAFTCNAVVNPILWAGLSPVYVDCADNFNIDFEDLKRKLTRQTKAIIIQHTFGLPVNMGEATSIVRQFEELNGTKIIIIEDCAHALGAEFNGKNVGTFGDVAFFSFSRDKVISSVYGGMAVTNNDEIGKSLQQAQAKFGQPGLFWVKQQLLHPILLNFIILPLYKFFDLGKIFLVLSQYLHLLSKAVSWQEKRGLRPDCFPRALPNAMATMALNQFNKLEKFNAHRRQIADFYYKELAGTKFVLPKKDGGIFLRFAVRHPQAHEIIYESWINQNILLGDWYRSPIDPHDTKLEEMKYEKGMCPNAERLAKQTLNLPTHININMNDAKRIVNFLKQWK
ncbi:MAG: DegT/DnrJ/EryC1/StrS aminotransferase family protein [Candidatus Staskawiczbacteria bacterium]|nr:DegT/DnrJ/EryC1/StrS aminotransferase family protein [Candidatus Staskawiczbacteria bacterium]